MFGWLLLVSLCCQTSLKCFGRHHHVSKNEELVGALQELADAVALRDGSVVSKTPAAIVGSPTTGGGSESMVGGEVDVCFVMDMTNEFGVFSVWRDFFEDAFAHAENQKKKIRIFQSQEIFSAKDIITVDQHKPCSNYLWSVCIIKMLMAADANGCRYVVVLPGDAIPLKPFRIIMQEIEADPRSRFQLWRPDTHNPGPIKGQPTEQQLFTLPEPYVSPYFALSQVDMHTLLDSRPVDQLFQSLRKLPHQFAQETLKILTNISADGKNVRLLPIEDDENLRRGRFPRKDNWKLYTNAQVNVIESIGTTNDVDQWMQETMVKYHCWPLCRGPAPLTHFAVSEPMLRNLSSLPGRFWWARKYLSSTRVTQIEGHPPLTNFVAVLHNYTTGSNRVELLREPIPPVTRLSKEGKLDIQSWVDEQGYHLAGPNNRRAYAAMYDHAWQALTIKKPVSFENRMELLDEDEYGMVGSSYAASESAQRRSLSRWSHRKRSHHLGTVELSDNEHDSRQNGITEGRGSGSKEDSEGGDDRLRVGIVFLVYQELATREIWHDWFGDAFEYLRELYKDDQEYDASTHPYLRAYVATHWTFNTSKLVLPPALKNSIIPTPGFCFWPNITPCWIASIRYMLEKFPEVDYFILLTHNSIPTKKFEYIYQSIRRDFRSRLHLFLPIFGVAFTPKMSANVMFNRFHLQALADRYFEWSLLDTSYGPPRRHCTGEISKNGWAGPDEVRWVVTLFTHFGINFLKTVHTFRPIFAWQAYTAPDQPLLEPTALDHPNGPTLQVEDWGELVDNAHRQSMVNKYWRWGQYVDPTSPEAPKAILPPLPERNAVNWHLKHANLTQLHLQNVTLRPTQLHRKEAVLSQEVWMSSCWHRDYCAFSKHLGTTDVPHCSFIARLVLLNSYTWFARKFHSDAMVVGCPGGPISVRDFLFETLNLNRRWNDRYYPHYTFPSQEFCPLHVSRGKRDVKSIHKMLVEKKLPCVNEDLSPEFMFHYGLRSEPPPPLHL